MNRAALRPLRGALVGCAVALTIVGVWSLPLYEELSLDVQALVDRVAICLWPTALFLLDLAFHACDPWEFKTLVAEYVMANALTYALVFALAGWIADAARWLRHRGRGTA